jgi:hypothetical protein
MAYMQTPGWAVARKQSVFLGINGYVGLYFFAALERRKKRSLGFCCFVRHVSPLFFVSYKSK